MIGRLFADRFLLLEGERPIDVASGERVALRMVTFDTRAQLHAWLQRCARHMERGEPFAARAANAAAGAAPLLVDFGTDGLNRYFEALACPPRAVKRAGSDARGASDLLPRLAEVLETGVSGRPRVLRLGVAEPRIELVRDALARESRLRGYIPVHPGRLQERGGPVTALDALQPLLHGRHVMVIHESAFASCLPAARLFVALGLDSHRPHVLLVLGPERVDARPRLAARGPRAPAVLRAREQHAGYGVVEREPAAVAGGLPPWRAPRAEADIAQSRSRILSALDSASRGRHATAIRTLRETLGMLTRRDDTPGAGETALVLGQVMLTRGHVSDAAASFEQARLLFDRCGLSSRAAAAALFVGLAWTDAGRWLEAEAAIRAALIASSAAGDRDGAEFGALALSRCLFWQGRLREAIEALPKELEPATDGGERVCEATPAAYWAGPARRAGLDHGVVRACLEARIAIAAGNLRAAGLAAATARERATLSGAPAEVAMACTSVAAVYAALGDAAALRPQIHEGLHAARRAHAPLRALRLRILLAQGLLRAGKAPEARPLVARLARLDLPALPAVVRSPVERVLAWKAPSGEKGAVPSRHDGEAIAAPEIIDTLTEILGLCQAIEDEETLLRKVMGTLRIRAGASAACCFGAGDGGLAPVAVEGREPAPAEVAERARETGLVIAPAATLSGLEAAVPVKCAGRVIGALACRWAADVDPSWPVSGALFAAAAASVAPTLRALLDRRAVPAPRGESAADEIVGASNGLRVLRQEIERAARAPFNVVIEGESGSGKELVARAIHRLGPRRHHRLCAVNCAAITDELLEAELFGHARGAFTGAVAERKGLFEEADGGTLVLDEVGELTPRAQAKLLRAIQEGEVRRLGENFSRPVDARIIAASNRPLRAAVEAGAFRRDLLYRLEVIRIVVPPLRERVDDIPVLAAHFWQQATARLGSRATLAPATVAALARYDWPGNVRELQNVMAALAVSAGRRGSVGPERLPPIIAGEAAKPQRGTLNEARRLFEARYVKAALARAGGQRAQAAKDLGLTRQGLAKLVARLGLDP